MSGAVTGVAVFLVGGLGVYGAWFEPTQAPPDGNLPAPITTGISPQVKSGALIVNYTGLDVGLNPPVGISVPHGRALFGYVQPTTGNPLPGQLNDRVEINGNLVINGALKPNGIAGEVGDILSKTATGMEWVAGGEGCYFLETTATNVPPALPAFGSTRQVQVPETCINSSCTIFMFGFNNQGQYPSGEDIFWTTDYTQIEYTDPLPANLSGSIGNYQHRWAKTGGFDGGANCSHGTNGVYGVGDNCNGILANSDGNLTLRDDQGAEVNPNRWALDDTNPDRRVDLFVCN